MGYFNQNQNAYNLDKVEKFIKASLDLIPLPWKFKLWAGKFAWGAQAKHWIVTSSKLSCQKFEFSLKVKVIESNPDYLLKSFLLYKLENKVPWFLTCSIKSHLPIFTSSGLPNVDTISPPVTRAKRSMPSKSACSMAITPKKIRNKTHYCSSS